MLGDTRHLLDEVLECQVDDFMMLLLVFLIFFSCFVLTNEIISFTPVSYLLVYVIS